jgi:tRNA threonylcarbamoyladenosine biosynthesis protein TsaB
VRILAIETSSPRGSVALVESGAIVRASDHELASEHAERILPLIEQLLSEAGWSRTSLDRIAAGVGPGSFTGLRVGMALADGIAIGLGIAAVGVGSLRAMTHAVPPEQPGARAALLDARRNELFVGAYDASGVELVAPCVLPRDRALAFLGRVLGEFVLVGRVVAELATGGRQWVQSPLAELPHAGCVGLIAAELDPDTATLEPIYVRGPNATLPQLPPSPLDRGTTDS